MNTANPFEYESTVRLFALLIGLTNITSLSLYPTLTCSSGSLYLTGLSLNISAPIVTGSVPKIL